MTRIWAQGLQQTKKKKTTTRSFLPEATFFSLLWEAWVAMFFKGLGVPCCCVCFFFFWPPGSSKALCFTAPAPRRRKSEGSIHCISQCRSRKPGSKTPKQEKKNQKPKTQIHNQQPNTEKAKPPTPQKQNPRPKPKTKNKIET